MSLARSARALLPFLLVLFFSSSAHAQINGVAAPTQGAGHDYTKMMNETVNPANGSVTIDVAVPTPPGRRLSLPFSFNYNSSGAFTPQGTGGGGAYMQNSDLFLNLDGWSYGIPTASYVYVTQTPVGQRYPCSASTSYVFADSKGTQFSFNSLIGYTIEPKICVGYSNVTNQSNDFYSASITGVQSPFTVTSLDNTRYTFFSTGEGCEVTNGGPFSTLPSTIEDRNGNIMTISGPPTTCNGSFTVTDTLGRTVISSSGFGATGNTITVPGLSAYSLTWGTVSPSYTPGSTWDNPSDTYCNSSFGGPRGTFPVITAITLPNGQQYSFSYDPVYGLLSKITYPNGGYISYTWGLNSRSDFTAVADANGSPEQCVYNYDTPALAHRYVSFDGSTIAQQQDFTYTTTWNPNAYSSWTTKTTTVTTHDLVNSTSFQTNYTYSPVAAGTGGTSWVPTRFGSQVAVEEQVVYKGTSGNTLRTVNKTWYDQYEIETDQTVLDNGQTSQVNFFWSNGLTTEKDEYDFGLTLKRKTTYTYGGGFNLPCKTIIYDGNSNRFAETDTYFDGSSTLCTAGTASTGSVSNLPPGTHDATNYAPTSTTERGNPTTVSKLCFTNCTNPVNTSFTYDETGQVLTSTDANSHTTNYYYSDSYTVLSGGSNVTYTPSYNTDAFLTEISNPLSQTVYFTYDFNTGQLTASKDENSQTTTYIYNDSLARPTQTNFPDGGLTTVSYNDSAHSVSTSKKMNSSQSINSTALQDGVGHVKETQVTSDPQGTIYADTSYDGLGRVRTVSNPYRSGSDPTTSAGTSTYFYDALGRKCLEVGPDGTLPSGNVCPTSQLANDVFTVYSGSTTTVSDQTGRSRSSVLDGLGRLIQVFENPTGLNYETDYSYDPLNNLLTVNQKGGTTNSSLWRTRTFVYDSLSRLVTSTNPEPGTTTYKYDSDTNCAAPNSFVGLLVSKTDARGIRTCFQYDAINRVTQKNYSDGTMSAFFAYDGTGWWGITQTNVVGRLMEEWTGTSCCANGGAEIFSYDAMGRVVLNEQFTPSMGYREVQYAYDLAGHNTSATYPSGRVVNYTFDSAGRPATAADSSNGITYTTAQASPPSGCLSSGVCYTPEGTEYSSAIGRTSAFTGVNLSETYNTRLQPLEVRASSSAGSALDITYSYADPLNGNANAGHVFSIANNLNSSRTQSFTYDALNRITSAGTNGTSGTYCWGYQYSVDAWGNLLAQAGWSPNYNSCSESTMSSVTANGNNQLSVFSYDSSGNTLSDGTFAYTYNAESEIATAAGVTYTYDAQGRRVTKSSGKNYVYGLGGEILLETDGSGNTLSEYVFFAGKRVAMLPAGGNALYYVEDMLGTSRVITQNNGTVCYDADFDPFGGEHAFTSNCSQNYKFEGKERDTETENDDFGARYYTSRFGRWLSADWSGVPVPVPYANLTNPQTLNLYAMVADDPESFGDLDGHATTQMYQLANPTASSAWDPLGANSMSDPSGLTQEEFTALAGIEAAQTAQKQAQNPLQTVFSALSSAVNNLPNGKAVSGDEISKQISDAAKSVGGLTPEAQEIVSNISGVTKNVETKKNGETETTINIVNKKNLDISVAEGITAHVGDKMSFRYSSSGGTATFDKFKNFGIQKAGVSLVQAVRVGPNGIEAKVGVIGIGKWLPMNPSTNGSQ